MFSKGPDFCISTDDVSTGPAVKVVCNFTYISTVTQTVFKLLGAIIVSCC